MRTDAGSWNEKQVNKRIKSPQQSYRCGLQLVEEGHQVLDKRNRMVSERDGDAGA